MVISPKPLPPSAVNSMLKPSVRLIEPLAATVVAPLVEEMAIDETPLYVFGVVSVSKIG